MHQANTRRSKFMRSAPQGRCGGPTVNICDVQGIISLAASRDDVQGGEATFRGVALRSLPPCTNPCTQQALHRLLYHACSCLHGTIGWTFGLLLELLFCDQAATMNTNGNSFGLECAVHADALEQGDVLIRHLAFLLGARSIGWEDGFEVFEKRI